MKQLPIIDSDDPISCGVGKGIILLPNKPINTVMEIVENSEDEILADIVKPPEKTKKPEF